MYAEAGDPTTQSSGPLARIRSPRPLNWAHYARPRWQVKDLVDFLREHWTALAAAPGAFAVLVILAFGAAFLVARWRYEAIVETLKERLLGLKERLEGKDAQLDEYRGRLHLIPVSGTSFSRLSNSELQRRVLDVVAEIRPFLAERGSRDRSLLFARTGRGREMSDEERQRDWDAQTNALLCNSFETATDFDNRYKVNTILLRDELLSRLPDGSKNEREFRAYEHPTNPIGMRMVADDLERLAKSLPANVQSAGA